MAEFPALPFWTDAYLGDTMHLSLEEHGAYLKLLMIMWRSPDCAIADDDRRISTMLGCTYQKWKTRLRPALDGFLMYDDKGQLTQKKLQKVRKNVEMFSEKQKRKANARWLKTKETDNAAASPRHMPQECQPKPYPSSKKDIPNGISKEKTKDPPKSKPKTKGSRLPDDWYPEDNAFAWSIDQIGAVETNGQIEHFKDHWKAESGSRSVKQDWDAAFRNWIRNHLKFGNSRPGGSQAASISTSVSNILAGGNSGPGLRPNRIPNDRANTSQRPGNGSGDAGSVTDAIEQIRDHAGTDDASSENSQPDSETKGSRAHAVRVC